MWTYGGGFSQIICMEFDLRIDGEFRQCINTGRHEKAKIHSGSTNFLQPRFGTFGLLVARKTEGTIERSMFFNGCRSSGRAVHKWICQNLSTWME
ncbi:hypothetical protein TNCV_3261271 [Trichonephila clavipes]|nr:hypothetical protein TNCV_3261271 [Trichonephila clavipes]